MAKILYEVKQNLNTYTSAYSKSSDVASKTFTKSA